MASLLYGSGLRLMEGLAMRGKDIGFELRQLIIRDAKGARDRVTVLPDSLAPTLRQHLERVREQHAADLRAGLGRAPLPFALQRKYPQAGLTWAWQFAFPSSVQCTSP